MRISDAARLSGVSTRLIRYYESEGLLSPTARDANGYRIFNERNVHELRFIKRARSLGFPIKQIDELLDLWRDKRRSSRKVRAVAERHKQAVVSHMEAHRSIVDVLSLLIKACKGDDRPDCPILDEPQWRVQPPATGATSLKDPPIQCTTYSVPTTLMVIKDERIFRLGNNEPESDEEEM